jgi:glycosyltransferase involved in cell wall biosynthesis
VITAVSGTKPVGGRGAPLTHTNNQLLSVVIPVYNEEEVIDRLASDIISALSARTGPWEVIVVNDGSRDATLAKLVDWHSREPRFKVIDLSRNFGHQRALFAGLSHASGDVIACIDGDLQDPPKLIPPMCDQLDKQDADVVYAVRRHRKENAAKTTAYWMAYRLMRWIMDIDLPLDSGDFAVMHRHVLEAMLRMPEQSLFLRGLRAWVGFRQVPFEYERAARAAGEEKYRWSDLFRLAYNGIFSFTKVPIRVLGMVGTAAILASICYSLWLFGAWLFGAEIPAGFSTLILAIIFFSGMQLVAIRILGAYIHRIYDEVRARPVYLVRKFWNGVDRENSA